MVWRKVACTTASAVPHFEKMLYDNALLAEAYSEAFMLWGHDRHRLVAQRTLDFVLTELTHPEGGFYTAYDADSEGVEGKFYTWTPQQVESALEGYDAAAIAAVCAYYGIDAHGNWEGAGSIPRPERSLSQVAEAAHMPVAALTALLEEARTKLYAARAQRVWPGLDHKVVTAYNGLMLSGLAAGSRALGDVRYLQAATRAAQFVVKHLLRPEHRLWRTFGGTKAHLDGYLEDYAYLAAGLLDLYEAGGAVQWLHLAADVANRMVADFCSATDGGFYDTAHGHEALLWRSRESHDGATPSPHAVAIHVLYRLAAHRDSPALQKAADRALAWLAPNIGRSPQAYSRALLTAHVAHRGVTTYAVVLPEAGIGAGMDGDVPPDDHDGLWRAVQHRYDPTRALAHGRLAAGPAAEVTGPILRGKRLVDGAAAVYICRGQTCGPPLTSAHAVATQL
ncbi:MAG: thioredoxin domain-containing protein [Deltaproteobacteria bacterium]|nr:MAG: thioredoxin domain-containing protein [Deltaproteobacteria bacterium]